VTEEERGKLKDRVAFWRGIALALLTFVFGNGVSYVVFGLHTASKSDVDRVNTQLSDRLRTLESNDNALESTVNQMIGALRVKHEIP